MQSDLFDDDSPPPTDRGTVPLAERMRPRSFDDIVGQQDVLGPGRPLREAIERDRLQSIILWGPPGTGKTTIARLAAERTKARFVSFSAVLVGAEGTGLPQAVVDAADARLTIPMQAPVESLNVAVAAAIILYEARRQRARVASRS